MGFAFDSRKSRIELNRTTMGRKILLISINRCVAPDPVFPLGLSYISSALQRAGHQTHWFDCQVDETGPLEKIQQEFLPDFIGISVRNIDDVLIRKQETFWGDLGSVCQKIRSLTESPIILGGSGFSIFPERLLEISGADFGICGEGETSLVRLIDTLEKRQNITVIPGLVFRQGNRIVVNPQHPLPSSHDTPSADRPEALARYYLEASGMLNVQTQRGCGYNCCYCTYPVIEGHGHRRREPEEVAEELSIVERMGAKYVIIVDSVFNSCARHVIDTCEAIIRRNLKIQWGCFLRPKGLTPEIMHLMRQAGLAHIEFGTDSFCDEVLGAYGKGFSFDDIAYSSELAQKENLDYCHFLICGGPGETSATMQQSFENSLRLKGGVIMAVAGMRVYPGTALQNRALKEGLITKHTDLLTPIYYLAPSLTTEAVFETLNRFATLAPNWIVGDPSPEYARLVQRLRQRRVVGPLWSYFSMIQRVWPQPSVVASQ